MGADTAGKQELEMSILQRAAIYTDSPEQAISIGECQSAARSPQGPPLAILGTLGDILIGRVRARVANEITVYDGTGVAAQDLAMASLVLERRPRSDIVTPAPTRAGQVQSSTGGTS
ncbi:alanine dehydrogenase [compost metagenome]